ncbi:unnamed protein product [Sphagnum troendelagicum]|uniref:Uncharacterized protein n=1 Tax=Sphagnum troendelagicum TaxID=128251 RepID=A0ABP0U359_9BRYO
MEPLCRELKGNADAVEFCNIPPYLNLLIAASYTLQKGPVPVCVGGLHVFSVIEVLLETPFSFWLFEWHQNIQKGLTLQLSKKWECCSLCQGLLDGFDLHPVLCGSSSLEQA